MQLVLLLCLTLLSSQVATLRRHNSRETKKKIKETPVRTGVAPSSRDFTFDLYRALAANAPGQNVFFSPLSVSMSLAIISLGTGSHTKKQILEGLGLSLQPSQEEKLHQGFQKFLQELDQPSEDFQLSLGSVFFTDPVVSIREAFLRTVDTMYHANIMSTNFEDTRGAKIFINDYVANQTQGMIVDLIQNLEGEHFIVMANYISFKAKWETAFSLKNTQEQDFHVTSERTVKVPMMSREDNYYYLLDQSLSCQVLGVPYQGNATAVLILPNQGKMEQVEKGLNEKILKKWLQTFTKRKLELFLPKFCIKGSYQLEKILPRMGISEVFTSHADLSGLTDRSNVQISEMVHKAVVEVDESGTKATTATGSVFMFRSAPLPSQVIRFDRPFLLIIVKNTDILFFGRVNQP